jgi:hypothetical protein
MHRHIPLVLLFGLLCLRCPSLPDDDDPDDDPDDDLDDDREFECRLFDLRPPCRDLDLDRLLSLFVCSPFDLPSSYSSYSPSCSSPLRPLPRF